MRPSVRPSPAPGRVSLGLSESGGQSKCEEVSERNCKERMGNIGRRKWIRVKGRMCALCGGNLFCRKAKKPHFELQRNASTENFVCFIPAGVKLPQPRYGRR